MNYKNIIHSASVMQISIGMSGLALFPTEQLEEEQVGYSIDPQGIDLTGNAEGDWKSEWVVIGYSTLLSDPIFINSQLEECPVFTAMHGAGEWNPRAISLSLNTFLESLVALQNFPPCLEEFERTKDRNKLTSDISNTLNALSTINGEFNIEYWRGIFDMLIEEIEETI